MCTFDFLGDSIVEASNYNVKNGPQAVNGKMSIDTSAITLVIATITKFNKESISAAKKINTDSLWTTSLTKDYLTTYAEGLSCSVFDRRVHYLNKKTNNDTWLVCHNDFFPQLTSYGTESRETSINSPYTKITKFHRIREVTLTTGNSITSSCGYVQG